MLAVKAVPYCCCADRHDCVPVLLCSLLVDSRNGQQIVQGVGHQPGALKVMACRWEDKQASRQAEAGRQGRL
jgi:hypothetical protein